MTPQEAEQAKELVRYELAKSIADTHNMGCECENCQLAYCDDFRTCDRCGRSRNWENVHNYKNEAGEHEAYFCNYDNRDNCKESQS